MPVLAVLWTMLYQPAQAAQTGLVNAALQVVGIPPQAWLHDPHLALPAIALMSLWQGVGLQMINAINARDIVLVQGLVLVTALLFVATNLIVDISYAFLDPRIRYGEAGAKA